MERKSDAKGVIAAIVVTVASVAVICGTFMYGRIIGAHYRTTIEKAANSFAEDIGEWIDEAKEYISNALNLAENPKR